MGVPYHLKGLQEVLIAHRDLFGTDAKPTKMSSGSVAVSAAQVRKTIKALHDASKEVSATCQQGLLAIELEPPSLTKRAPARKKRAATKKAKAAKKAYS
jgi:hypothetical protein